MDTSCGQTDSSRDYYHYAQLRRTATAGDRLPPAAGMDAAGDMMERGRSVRERLEATLAGLGELDHLRHRQELLVRSALHASGSGDPGRPGTAGVRPGTAGDEVEDPYLNCEEKLLEENILLLRKQLNCLRRRDAGLISQLQELDRQISDLRLDTEISHDHMETDSRPSSGFYDLSDGVNGSLSNSSNSVFSECLSSSRSSTADELVGYADCEGLLVLGIPYEDQTSSGTVRRSLSAPYPSTCSSSLDLPPSTTFSSSSADSRSAQTKYQCDLVARHGSDVYRYPSPLHAVAVQSPMFFQTLSAGHQGLPHVEEASLDGLTSDSPPRNAPSVSAPQVHQSTSWSTPSSSCFPSQTPSSKRLEGYIFSLLQRRSQPVRPNKPRTSINTDPAKSIHRQPSLCGRQGPGLGQGTLRGSEPRTSWQAGVVLAGTVGFEGGSVESKREEQAYHSQGQTQNGYSANNGNLAQNGCSVNGGTQQDGCSVSSSGLNGYTMSNCDVHLNNNSLLEKKGLSSGNKATASSTGTLPSHYKDLGSPTANSSPKELKHSCYPLTSTTDPEPPVKSPRTVKPQSATPQKSPKPHPLTPNGKGDRSLPELVSQGSSSQSQDEGGGGGHMVSVQHLPTQRHAAKLRKGGGKNLKMNVKKNQPTKVSRSSENSMLKSDRTTKPRGSSRRTPQYDEIITPHQKVSKRGTVAGGAPGVSASRLKRIPPSIPEDQVFLDKPIATSTLISNASTKCGVSRQSNHHRAHHGHHGSHHHHHGRDPVVVVAKPKYKRNDYRHLRAMAEVPYDEAFRRAQRRQRKELLSQNGTVACLPTAGRQYASPYAYAAGSDSEYSAECASLFHSTIMDTSEDERSNYTTNRFGDSESSESEGEFEGDSTSVSDSQESGAGGAQGGGGTRSWAQLGGAGSGTRGQDLTPAQAKAFVKIKASHNLKKRILRFKSGSLKLMTTV